MSIVAFILLSSFLFLLYNVWKNFHADLTNGVVTIGNSSHNNVGTIALPIDTLCTIPGVNDYLACFICNDDCLYVHNTFGGTCGARPGDASVKTCLCADTQADATARGISSDSTKTCKVFDPIGKAQYLSTFIHSPYSSCLFYFSFFNMSWKFYIKLWFFCIDFGINERLI